MIRFSPPAILIALLAITATACGGPKGERQPGMDADEVAAWQMQYSLARGGRLYDNWYKEIDIPAPKTGHTAYPATGHYAAKAKSNWRCKECHGWDYLGVKGAYATGKHHTGITGIDKMRSHPPAAIIAILKDDTHGMAGLISQDDFQDLANFVSMGQVDTDRYIDRTTRRIKDGNVVRGQAYFNTLCAHCHGLKGQLPRKMKPLGKLVNDNPWEVLHKVLNGQPDEEMPALRALAAEIPALRTLRNPSVPLDIMAYLQTLPRER